MNRNNVLVKIGGCFLIVTLLLTGGCFKKKQVEDAINDDSSTAIDLPSNTKTAPTVEAYQSQLKQILRVYWSDGDTLGIKDKILALTTPTEFLNLHLDLVIAFELIEQGNKNNDQEKILEGTAKLDQLKVKYSWLTNN